MNKNINKKKKKIYLFKINSGFVSSDLDLELGMHHVLNAENYFIYFEKKVFTFYVYSFEYRKLPFSGVMSARQLK